MLDTYLLLPAITGTKRLAVDFAAFPDSELHCSIQQSAEIKDRPVLIVHRLYPDPNGQFLRLLFLIDLLRDLGATNIDVFCPYLAYSRQDKRHLPGESLGIQTFCRLLANAGCRRLYTLDCHFMRVQDKEIVYGGLQIKNVSVLNNLLNACTQELKDTPFEVIAADEGAAAMGTDYQIAYMRKTRGSYTRRDSVSRDVVSLTADHLTLTSDTAVVIDDMVSTGSTMLRAVANLRQKGVKHVHCVLVHGLFLRDSLEQLRATTDSLWVSDSVLCENAIPTVDAVLDEVIIPHWQLRTSAHPQAYSGSRRSRRAYLQKKMQMS